MFYFFILLQSDYKKKHDESIIYVFKTAVRYYIIKMSKINSIIQQKVQQALYIYLQILFGLQTKPIDQIQFVTPKSHCLKQLFAVYYRHTSKCTITFKESNPATLSLNQNVHLFDTHICV